MLSVPPRPGINQLKKSRNIESVPFHSEQETLLPDERLRGSTGCELLSSTAEKGLVSGAGRSGEEEAPWLSPSSPSPGLGTPASDSLGSLEMPV